MVYSSKHPRELWKIISKAVNNVTHNNDSSHSCCETDAIQNKLFKFNHINETEYSCDNISWIELVPHALGDVDNLPSLNLPSIMVRIYTSLDDNRTLDRTTKRNCLLRILTGFDNTGNVRLWTSELLLAHTILYGHLYPKLWSQLQINFCEFPAKYVCELGAGMTGAAGLAFSIRKNCPFICPSSIILSDGNDRCVESLDSIVSLHCKRLGQLHSATQPTVCIKTQNIRWSNRPTYGDSFGSADFELLHRFDLVVAADCFFDTTYHEGLLATIDFMLSTRPGSTFLAVAPLRNGTLIKFINAAKDKAWCNVVHLTPYMYVSSSMRDYLLDNCDRNNFTDEELDKSVGQCVLLIRTN